jgi:hypothetical protein
MVRMQDLTIGSITTRHILKTTEFTRVPSLAAE